MNEEPKNIKIEQQPKPQIPNPVLDKVTRLPEWSIEPPLEIKRDEK